MLQEICEDVDMCVAFALMNAIEQVPINEHESFDVFFPLAWARTVGEWGSMGRWWGMGGGWGGGDVLLKGY